VFDELAIGPRVKKSKIFLQLHLFRL